MIGIISDIHGNHVALAAVLGALDERGVSAIICLGDVGGYYNQVNECCQSLRLRGVFTLMGNHDWYLTTGERCPRSNSANDCLQFQRRIITSDNLTWLSGLPQRAIIQGIDIVHGGWNDPLDEYVAPSAAYFAGLAAVHLASGHTHVPCLWSDGCKNYCNPGSVGQPRDGNPEASYALWDGVSFRLCRVGYDIDSIQREMAAAGFTPYFYENLRKGVKIGG